MTDDLLRTMHTGNCHCVYCMAAFEAWSDARREAERKAYPKTLAQLLEERERQRGNWRAFP